MKNEILEAGTWMMEHPWLVLGLAVCAVGAWCLVRRYAKTRRRLRRPMMTLDLTGWRRLSPVVVMTEKDRLDHIADVSFAAGLAIGGVGMAALVFIVLVLCLRGSGNRPRNGRGVS